MTQDQVIAAAREAGGTPYTNRHYPGETACAFGPEALARFYAIAYRQGMERAAEICDHGAEAMLHGFKREGAARCAESIRLYAQNQPKTTHDGSVVSKN